jgi:hypothetical protein
VFCGGGLAGLLVNYPNLVPDGCNTARFSELFEDAKNFGDFDAQRFQSLANTVYDGVVFGGMRNKDHGLIIMTGRECFSAKMADGVPDHLS